MSGFNLKYRYEQDDNPLGVIGSFAYTEKIVLTVRAITTKGQYYGITAGPGLLRLRTIEGRASTV